MQYRTIKYRLIKWWWNLNWKSIVSQDLNNGYHLEVWQNRLFKRWLKTDYFLRPPKHINCRCEIKNVI